jgi:hypothetical protein
VHCRLQPRGANGCEASDPRAVSFWFLKLEILICKVGKCSSIICNLRVDITEASLRQGKSAFFKARLSPVMSVNRSWLANPKCSVDAEEV